MQHNMHLTPAVERLYSRKPIKALAEELTLESETVIASNIILLSILNPPIESPIEEPELILEPPATELISFEAEFENLLKKQRDDKTLQSVDMRKLTIHMLKSKLLYHGLSIIRKKKEDLIQHLFSHLSKVNN